MRGNAAIAAEKKAMDDRKAAEQLTADAAKLGPVLEQAQTNLITAQTDLSGKQQAAKLSQASFDRATAAAKQAQGLAQSCRDAATKLANDGGGMNDLLKAVGTKAGEVDALMKGNVSAVTAADQASSSYNAAVNDYRKYLADLTTAIDSKSLEANPPYALKNLTKDERIATLLFWSQSAALQQGARANLAAASALEFAGAAVKMAADAKVAGDVKIPDAAAYRKEADSRFQRAVTPAAYGPGAPGGDVDKIKWIGKSLEATAQYGRYLATGNAESLKAALAARDEAAKRSPNFGSEPGKQLSWMK